MIALDIMGGDYAPDTTVAGAQRAASEGVDVILVGDQGTLSPDLRNAIRRSGLAVAHAEASVSMEAKGAVGAADDGRTSLRVAAELVKSGEAGAMVTMGNTGAGMVTALRVLGRLPGVERPALAVSLPAGPNGTLLLDAGANADARPAHLLQFAQLGSAFMQSVRGVSAPRVGLLSNGEEATKGSKVVIETHQLLRQTDGLNFVGNVEGRDLLGGRVEVVVTDGFSGNIAVKLLEGVAAHMFGQVRRSSSRSLRGRIGEVLLGPSLRGARDELSARHHGAVPLLGVNGAVFIGHGSSDAETVATALKVAHDAVHGGMISAFSAAIGADVPTVATT